MRMLFSGCKDTAYWLPELRICGYFDSAGSREPRPKMERQMRQLPHKQGLTKRGNHLGNLVWFVTD